jgi:predicted Zn-dependent protease
MQANNTLRFIESNNKSITIMINNKKVKRVVENNESNLRIDAIFDKKRIIRSIDTVKKDKLENILNEMKTISKIKELEFYSEFPDFKILDKKIISDEKLKEKKLKEIIDFSLELNKKLLTNKFISDIQSFTEIDYDNTKFISKNQEYIEDSFDLGLTLEINIKNKTLNQITFTKNISTISDFNIDKIYCEIIEEIEYNIDPIEFEGNPKDYNIIFSPNALEKIIDYFIVQQSLLENVIRKDSYLMHTEFDSKINIIEKPFIDYSPYSNVIDLDFINTREKYIVKDGKFSEYICNLGDACKYNKDPSGNALPGNITNLIFESGTKSKNELLNKGKILYIDNLLGIHTTNSKEGSLNVSALGAELNNGKLVSALKDIKLNEKIQDLFKIVEISKETKWIGNYNLPYILCVRDK